MNRPASTQDATAPIVIVHCGSNTEQIAHAIQREHHADGALSIVTSTIGIPDPATVILVFASDAFDSPGFTDLTNNASRLVPVAVGDMAGAAVPGRLSELNWIIWDGDVERVAAAAWNAGRTDATQHELMQAARAQAAAWDLTLRQDADLISDMAEVRRLAAVADHHPTSETLVEFIQASTHHARTVRRVTRRRIIVRIGLATLFAAVCASGFVAIQRLAEQQRLMALIAAPDAGEESRPEVQALKYAAFLRSGRTDPEVATEAYRKLDDALSKPWPRGHVGSSPTGMAINDVAYLPSGAAQIWVDGGGSLWLADPTENTAEVMAEIRDTPLYAVATADGRTVWTTDGNRLILLKESAAEYFASPNPIESLYLADGDNGSLVVASDSSYAVVREQSVALDADAWRDGRILTASDTRIVVRGLDDSPGVVVLDLTDGEARSVPDDLIDHNSKFALLPEGGVVVSAADQQLWWMQGTGKFEPTGHRVAPVVTDIAATASSEVVVTTRDVGSRVLNLGTGLVIGSICNEGVLRESVVSPDGRWFSCNYGMGSSTWHLDDLRPIADGVEESPQHLDSTGETTARVSEDGLVTIEQRGREWTHKSPGAVSVSVSPDQSMVAVGKANGSVRFLEFAEFAEGTPVLAGGWAMSAGSPVLKVKWNDHGAQAVSRIGTWQMQVCQGCLDDFALAIDAFRERALPCYDPSIQRLVTGDQLETLGISTCHGVGS